MRGRDLAWALCFVAIVGTCLWFWPRTTLLVALWLFSFAVVVGIGIFVIAQRVLDRDARRAREWDRARSRRVEEAEREDRAAKGGPTR